MNQFLSFFFGLLAGFTITMLCIYPEKLLYQSNFLSTNATIFDNKTAKPLIVSHSTELQYDDYLSEKLSNEVRILCWVLTGPNNHKKKAVHVMRTWGQRCTKILFMSSQVDPVLDSIALPVKEGRNNLWDKTKHALQYIYNHHFNSAEWFLKVDDDNYVIPENLRYMLSRYRPETSLYFGHRYSNENLLEGYMAGGGYILSKKALEKFVTRIMRNHTICSPNNAGSEDWEVGRCLQHSAIFADERDDLLQKRFFPAGLPDHLKRKKDPNYWYDVSQYYEVAQGSLKCCSDVPISFHYVTPKEMYALEYFIRHVHPFGVERNLTEILPSKLKLDDIIRASDVESASKNFRKHKFFHNMDDSEKIFFNKDAPKDTKIGNVSLYEEKLSNQIFNNVKVLCLVMTYPENHRTKAIYVKETWGKRCNKLFFMTSEHDQLLETVIVSHNESRDFLWDKTKKSFQYAHDNLLADFDWFLKADDDTYMVMENLRYMLSQYNEEDSLYFGHRYAVTSYMENGYMAGGGYVLSKAALKAFIKELADSDSNCSKSDLGVEDFEMGHCLNGIAIEVDCRDEKHGKRFFPIGVEPHMEREIDFNYWYFRRLHYNTTQGKLSCCSDTLAQMHYIYPEEMFKFEYFIYNVHPFGSIENISEILPRKLGMDEIVKASNVESFRHQFAKEIHDQAHQRRDRDRGEKNRSKSQTSSESSSQIDSLDQSLELIKNLNNQLD